MDFNAAIANLVTAALSKGVPPGHVILALELLKADVIRAAQDKAREQQILPASAAQVPGMNFRG